MSSSTRLTMIEEIVRIQAIDPELSSLKTEMANLSTRSARITVEAETDAEAKSSVVWN